MWKHHNFSKIKDASWDTLNMDVNCILLLLTKKSLQIPEANVHPIYLFRCLFKNDYPSLYVYAHTQPVNIS